MTRLSPEELSPPADALRTRDRVLYGLGHFGLSLLGYMVVACVMPFYHPAKATAGATSLVSSATLIAAVLFVGRLIDFIADPLAGYLSDGTHTRWGRRKPYMVIAAPLLALAFALIWRPPVQGSSDTNAWYALILLCAVFIFYAAYAAPYLGLLPEIARGRKPRVRLATVQGFFHLLGITVAAITVGNFCPVYGFARVAGALSVLCLLSMWVACLGPHEQPERLPAQRRELGLGQALKRTFTNWPFLLYWAGYYLLWTPLLVILAGMEYAASAFMDLQPGAAGAIVAVPLVGGMLLLPFAKRLVERHGPRWTFLAGLLWFAVTAPPLALVGLGGDAHTNLWLARLLSALLSPAVAVIFTVPYTIMADVCDLDFRQTGHHREAMYFGFQGLMMKAGLGFAPLIAAITMQTFGTTGTLPLGYRMFGPVAGAMALLGFVIFLFYREESTASE
ncbi:MAG: MFS transporter [Armatimonadia bacterium]